MIDALLGLLQSKEFWTRVVALVLFVVAWFGIGTENVDAGQITDIIVSIVGALIVFDPFKIIVALLGAMGIWQPGE